jgi:hypothetical protein
MRFYNRHLAKHHNLHQHKLPKAETYPLDGKDYFFSIKMKIGNIDYDLSIDTGSSDIFIKGEKSAG